MSAARHRAGFTLLVLAAVVSCAAAGCSFGDREDGSQAEGRVLRLVRHQAAQAAAALLEGDREGFLSSFPADAGEDAAMAREDLGDVFDTLSPLRWTSFAFRVSPVDPAQGVYRISGMGRLGEAGPPDRIAVVRHVRFAGVADGVSVTADETPEDLRSRYLMALHEPVVLQRRGLVVVGERRARDRAKTVLAAAARARPRLERLGIDTGPAAVVTVYGSAGAARAALGVDAAASRLVFFAHPPLRMAAEDWPVCDVGVMGPWLRDVGGTLDGALRHELAHAYTVQWFAGDASPPALLVEGIAQAAEGVDVDASLRREVETGDQLWPLPGSFADDDVWAGGDAEAVHLGYQIGGALIGYVVSHWGAAELRPFVQAVAAAEPTSAGMDEALRGCLGVDWSEFYDGWRRYVLDGG
ncbi:MAG: hypothetical protein GX624_08300 [Actinobacteria bacterium]|nr:hypothetical protein [Actinomycetota bacterium]